METTERQATPLPMGIWLAQERQRLGKTCAEVAKAVRSYSATIRSIEQKNRVLPPGWYQDLRALGMNIHEPVWSTQLPPYLGAALQRELRTRAGLHHTRVWISKQLCVPESDVTEVVRHNLPVPHSWLLKLAELGASVPEPVRRTLYHTANRTEAQGSASPLRREPAVPLRWPIGAPKLPFDLNMPRFMEVMRASIPSSFHQPPEDPGRDPLQSRVAPEPTASRGSIPPSVPPDVPKSAEGPAPSGSPGPDMTAASAEVDSHPLALHEQRAFYFLWTEERGLSIFASALLLEQIPGALSELLIRMVDCGLLDRMRAHSTPAQGT